MKATLLVLLLIISQVSYSTRTCDPYIPDEWPYSRYSIETISADNIVTDHKTGLVWKQCSEGLSGIDCMTGTATTHTWQQALNLAEAENIVGYAGYSDWRLPNVEELRSLVAYNCYNPSINENAFPNMLSDEFWSSSPVASDDDNSSIVSFRDGIDYGYNRDVDFYVRLVRSGQ